MEEALRGLLCVGAPTLIRLTCDGSTRAPRAPAPRARRGARRGARSASHAFRSLAREWLPRTHVRLGHAGPEAELACGARRAVDNGRRVELIRVVADERGRPDRARPSSSRTPRNEASPHHPSPTENLSRFSLDEQAEPRRFGGRGALPDAVHDDHGRAAGRRSRQQAHRLDAHLDVTLDPSTSFEGIGAQKGDLYGSSGRSRASSTGTTQLHGEARHGRPRVLAVQRAARQLDGDAGDLAVDRLPARVQGRRDDDGHDGLQDRPVVKAMGRGSDAARWCIGMPIN